MILTEVKVKWSVILMNLLGQDTFLRYEWEKKFVSWASTFEIKKDPCWSWKSSSSRLELSLSWMVVFHYLPLVFPPKTLRIQLESLGYLLLIFALFIRHFFSVCFKFFFKRYWPSRQTLNLAGRTVKYAEKRVQCAKDLGSISKESLSITHNIFNYFFLIYSPQFNKYKPLIYITQ